MAPGTFRYVASGDGERRAPGTGRGRRNQELEGTRAEAGLSLVFILVSHLAPPPREPKEPWGRGRLPHPHSPGPLVALAKTGDLAQWPAGRDANFRSCLMKGDPKAEAGLWSPWDSPPEGSTPPGEQ